LSPAAWLLRLQLVVDEPERLFAAPARKLIVEVDGGYHGDLRRQRADARRDKRLQRAGYRVLRLPAELVLGNLPRAVEQVRAALGA
jgi:very-short-patch-repair endonuclease